MAAALRTRLLSLAVLALVFVSGVVVGVAVDRRLDGEPAVAARDDDDDDDDRRDRDGDDRRMLYERVEGLRDGQETRIDSVLTHHREAMRGLNRELRDDYQAMRDLQKQYRDAYYPRYWAIVDSTRAAIRSIFDPAQATQYDSLVAEFDRRRRDERSDSSGR
jgi:hypothetical protein